MSFPRDLFDELSPNSRSVVSEVADYYCLQVAGSNEPDLLTPLFQVRESLSCLALTGELSADIRAELAVIAPQLLSSVAIRDDSDRDQLPSQESSPANCGGGSSVLVEGDGECGVSNSLTGSSK